MIHYRAEKMKNAAKSLWLLFAQAFGVFGGWGAKRGLGATGGEGRSGASRGRIPKRRLGTTGEGVRFRCRGGIPDIFIPPANLECRHENSGMTRGGAKQSLAGTHSQAELGNDRKSIYGNSGPKYANCIFGSRGIFPRISAVSSPRVLQASRSSKSSASPTAGGCQTKEAVLNQPTFAEG